MSQKTDGSYYEQCELRFGKNELKSVGFVFHCDHGSGSVTFTCLAPQVVVSGTTFYEPPGYGWNPDETYLVDITEDLTGYAALPATSGQTDFAVSDTKGLLRLYDRVWWKAVISTGGANDANYSIKKRDIIVGG